MGFSMGPFVCLVLPEHVSPKFRTCIFDAKGAKSAKVAKN